MTEVTAPYNFVPLSDKVCGAEDLGLPALPSQDSPMGGESGCIEVTLSCDGPLLVNWGKPRVFEKVGDKPVAVKTFGLAPGGAPAIPGSTLRGLIRNVVEIAAFGKMTLADDARVGVRDLYAKADYTDKITSGDKDTGYFPLSQAGWLRIENGALRLTPCSFGRIDHSDLSKLSAGFRTRVLGCISDYGNKTVRPPEWKDMTQAQNVEAQFRQKCQSIEHELWVQQSLARHPHSQPLRYQRVASEKADAERTGDVPAIRKRGTLVFTGMASNKKHMEFFFFDDRSDLAFDVPPSVWSGFLDVHERQEKPSPTWEWRKAALAANEAIPVFYLTDDKTDAITRIGLAMMFKVAADRSIGEMIANTQKDDQRKKVDLAELIFGRLKSEKSDGWRGRVSFGWALADVDSCHEPNNEDKRVILGKPKPSFTPAYVRQRDFAAVSGRELLAIGEKKANYRSYMNWSPTPTTPPIKEELRGWKRYPVGPERGIPPQSPFPTGEGVSILRPLRPAKGRPITFDFRLRYHNLNKVELGALLWALTWGGDTTLRHSLGMGRPLGWGQVLMAANLNPEQSAAVTAFAEAMEGWANRNRIPGGWAGSVQIRQLKAMANPATGRAQATVLQQMRLVVGQANGNDFAKAKKAGTILPEYAGLSIADLGRPVVSQTPKKTPPQGGGQQGARPGQRPATQLNTTQRGQRAFCNGEEVTVLRDDGDRLRIRYPDGEEDTVSRKEMSFR